MKDKRKANTAKLFNKLKYLSNIICFVFFLKLEKNFCQHQMVNSQNNHWLVLSTQNVVIVIKTKQQVHIIEFGVITNNANVIPPFSYPHGLRLNMEAYINCFKQVVLPWIERVAASRPYIWKQDSALYYISRRTQCLLIKNLCDHITINICPFNSPDCNPFDYV